MKGTKYLSDVLDTSLFEKGVMNVVEAPCGSGKTTCAINRIATLASSPKKALFLIDTTNGFQRLAQEEKLTTPYLWYPETIAGRYFNADRIDDKVVVATYARFGVWVEQYPNFTNNFEIIICDEAHNMVQFSTYSEEPNYTSIARDAIRDAVLIGKTTIVAITATPELLYEHKRFRHLVKKITVPDDIHRYIEHEVIPVGSAAQALEQVSVGQRGALYTTLVTQIKQYEKLARAKGFNPLCLWSPRNTDHIMTAEQEAARQYILKEEEVPDQYDLFIFNGSGETCINIRSHMDFVIVNTTDETHITQARGRYRADLDKLYVLDRENAVIVVPDTFMNRWLFKEDKQALRERLAVKNDKGLVPWKDLEGLMTASGYTITKGTRVNNRPRIMISKL